MSFRDRVLAVGGRGQLRGKLLNLMPVMSGSGPEYDVGQLVTYVNNASMVAPSMLLTSGVTWKGVDDNSFDLTLVDRGNTVTARVFVDDDGHLVDFSTTDPYFTSPKGLQQAAGPRRPTAGPGRLGPPDAEECADHLASAVGNFCHGPDLAFEALEFNVAPQTTRAG